MGTRGGVDAQVAAANFEVMKCVSLWLPLYDERKKYKRPRWPRAIKDRDSLNHVNLKSLKMHERNI